MSTPPVTIGAGGAPAEPDGFGLAALPTGRRTRRRSPLLRLLETPSSAIGLLIVVFWVGCALFWPLIVPYDPDSQNYSLLLGDPSREHLFGTDHLGRDVLSRVLAGSREVLLLAPAATLLGLLGGIAVGLSAAYYRGWYDEVLMRVMDAIMAFPFIILALLILAVTGPSAGNLILGIGLGF